MELKPSELRLGNLLQDRKGLICQAERLENDIEECKILAIKGGTTHLPVEPIPLTPEILLKAGFEYNKEHETYLLNCLTKDGIVEFYCTDYELNYSFGKRYDAFRTMEWVDLVEIKYLHQLQNLYFSLVGSELKIDL